MKRPAFTNTVRFKIGMWYLWLFIFFFFLIVGAINLAMHQSLDPISSVLKEGKETQSIFFQQATEYEKWRLRIYSLTALGLVPFLGLAGGYFIAGRMLKPVSDVASLAARISSTNLQERIDYKGPDSEIKSLADTFDEMLERLETAFESQKQFIQDASHELRTPIATAQTNIEVAELAKKVTASDYKHLMEVIKQSLERMTQLSDQLLLLADDAQGRVKWQAVDMKSVIDEVADEVSAKMKVAGISLELEMAADGMVVTGDALRLKQVIFNLIENAVKYNRPAGMIKISGRVEESGLVIRVQDNGIGISPADQVHIFDRFYRVDKSRTRSKGGSGLGLAIVKKIVEEHGGTISVESTLDEGSTFQIVLPGCLQA